MPTKRIFISGVMISHELDADREAARQAINSLSPEFVALGYRPFATGEEPFRPPEGETVSRHEIAGSDALILLVGESFSAFCAYEFAYARRLGLPRRVFARQGVQRSPKLKRFLSACRCEVVTYSVPSRELVVLVQEFCRSTQSATDEKHQVLVHTVNVWQAIVRELSQRPEKVFSLSPRKFEELLAEIIASFGYTTSLTPCTRDGGFDIRATRRDPLFPSLYLVEAKLWTPPRAVGRPVIQGIYGTGMADNCNGVMVVTPSTFSRDAVNFLEEKRLKEYVRLVDGVELPRLYEHYLTGAIENNAQPPDS